MIARSAACVCAALLIARGAEAQPRTEPVATMTLTRNAAAAGLLTCAGRIEQIARFLGEGNTLDARFSLPAPPRDRRLAAASMAIAPPAGPASYASAQFAATADGCDAVYETVTYWPSPCADLAAARFAGVPAGPPLGTGMASLMLGGNASMFLMPAGPGCVVIKTDRI